MSKSSAGTVLCEPTELYNILTRGAKTPAFLEGTYLAFFDARTILDYHKCHVMLARSARNERKGSEEKFRIPSDVHLPTVHHCIVYDSSTVSKIENTAAVEYANLLAASGSKNPVMILKGGYERFSAEYPFLRTHITSYTPRELLELPHYPNEIVPLFLYLGEKCDADNADLNYDLKIRSHILLGEDMSPTLPEKIKSLHIKVKDQSDEDLLSYFPEVCNFLEKCWKKNERVLVYEEIGCSRSATVVMAYLIKKNNMKLKEAFEHIQKCRQHVLPLQTFIDQLSNWENQVLEL